MSDLYTRALACIEAREIEEKILLSRQTAEAWRAGQLVLEEYKAPVSLSQAGLPQRLKLVAPRDLPRRSMASRERHAALIHAIGHIEFNAINLAWDAVYRFRGLPSEYYTDWIAVAEEEVYHFELIRAHLNTLGYDYGDFPGHDGLWRAACETEYDVLARMAIIPRVMEARGLDVTPGIMQRLREQGDPQGVAVLEVILRDEIGHVARGSRWFDALCRQRGVDPWQTFQDLIRRHGLGRIRGPFHVDARLSAGFTEQELQHLEQMQWGEINE